MAHILIVGQGGFGDMFPLFSIATALRAGGHRLSIAAEPHHAAACAALDIAHHPLGTLIAAQPDSGLLESLRDQLLATLSPAGLSNAVEQLLPLARDADLILGNQLAYAGAIVRDLLGKPWVYCAASPLSMPSRLDPPLWPYVAGLQALTARWGVPESVFVGLMRQATRALMEPQRRLRRRLGLPRNGHPRFEGMYSAQLNLLTASPLLLAPQSDWPPRSVLTGFCWFEPSFLGDPNLTAELVEFATRGEPPIVLAPGGARRGNPPRFFRNAVAACRKLGRRMILVAAPRFHAALPTGPDVKLSGYMPYARLFGLASVVVHSGGIGTIGWAMRQGVPSLLLPEDWDQHDNARRAERRGYARVLGADASADRIALMLGRILEDAPLQERLRRNAPIVAAEDGAAIACRAIEDMLATHAT